MASRFKSKLCMVFSHCPHPKSAAQAMLPYPREGSSPRAAEVNADIQSESNVTKVLASRLKRKLFMVLSNSPLPFDSEL